MRLGYIVGAWALFVLAMSPSIVHAQGTPDADARKKAAQAIRESEAHIEKKQYDEAIAKIERAYELDPQSEHLYNFGVAYHLKGDLEKALEYYQRFLASDSDNRALIRRTRTYVADLEKQIADQRAEREASELVELRRRVDEQERELEALRRERDKGSDTGGSRTTTTEHVGTGLLAAGGVALGIAVVYGLDARSAHAELDGLGQGDTWSVSRDWLVERGAASERNLIIFSSVGGALVLGGLTLHYLGRRQRKAAEKRALTAVPSLTRDSASILVTGRF